MTNPVYSSFLVDTHITEHDESFLTKFDPASFVAAIKQTGASSAMVYACCHNGNCHYPTRVGHMHKNLHGRDIFGETIKLLRAEGIVPRAYYTIVYQRHAARNNPDWRVSQVDGAQNYRRSWYNCPNSEGYRQFVKAHVAEIAAYDVEGMFVDMTFWPGICVCHSCRSRYLREAGSDIPMTINWDDPTWVRFQRSRERWLAEAAHDITGAIKAVNPNIAVSHQFSPAILGWMYGQSPAMALASDLPSGDFYGGKHQQRMGAKVLAAFTKKLPYEFMASRCVSLYDHTSNKSEEELLCSCATTLANGGSYLLIDAINPDGTLEQPFYKRMTGLAKSLEPFKRAAEAHRPVLQANVGLYFSMASQVRRDHNGKSTRAIMDPANNMLAGSDLRPMQELLGTSVILNRAKIPYRVITELTTDFTGLTSIIINDAAYLSADEVERLRQFVRNGGTLIATGLTSYYDIDGHTTGDFALADVFGVSFAKRFTKQWSYTVPAERGETMSCKSPGPVVNATTATVLARLAEPIFDPDDFEHFASYHSNPPGPTSEHAALTVNRYGRGKCVFLYCSSLSLQQEAQQTFGAELFRTHAPSSIVRSTNAPHSVEITLLRSTTTSSYLLCLVNYQDELPNIPVHDLEVTLALPGNALPASCRRISDGRTIEFALQGEQTTLKLSRLTTLEMIEIAVKDR